MTYTVAEAERILAEAKAREARDAWEPDYEAWRPALQRFYEASGVAGAMGTPLDRADKSNIRGLIAVVEEYTAPVQPTPAPSEEDDLRLAREVCALRMELSECPNAARMYRDGSWDDTGPIAITLAAIRAERKRAGGVKAEPEWIDWHGGECPVPAGTWVEVWLRCGWGGTDDGALYEWDHTAHKQNWEIVRYRILGEQP